MLEHYSECLSMCVAELEALQCKLGASAGGCEHEFPSQRLYVSLWHIHRPRIYDMVSSLRPVYIPRSEPLGC